MIDTFKIGDLICGLKNNTRQVTNIGLLKGKIIFINALKDNISYLVLEHLDFSYVGERIEAPIKFIKHYSCIGNEYIIKGI